MTAGDDGDVVSEILQFVAALQHAKILDRILIIPPETSAKQFTAMTDPSLQLWDLRMLRDRVDCAHFGGKI